MPVNIQHRILNSELAPPGEVWQAIARRLDEEFDSVEISVAERISDISLAPPSNAWSRIAGTLSQPEQYEEPARQAKVVPMMRRRLAVAATIAALVIAGVVLYYQFNQRSNTGQSVVTTTGGDEPAPSNPQPVDDSFIPDTRAAISGLIPRRTRVRASTMAVQTASITPEVSAPEFTEPQPELEFHTAAVRPSSVMDESKKIAVAAPPIRDSKGRLVLNLDLLRSDDTDYVTVTSPGGEQTRISSKFVNMLSYLNNDPDTKEQYIDFLFRQSSEWKKKFEEWRQRILASPTFSPTNATFFDILEMWELVKEK